MNRNIAKPFVATLSLLDVASDKTHKYKCFHGEDVQLTVNVVGEEGRRIDLSNTSVKIYFTLDKNVNEPVYRQDTGIVVNNFGVITVMLEKSYIRIGNNTLKIALYDEDQTVFLQPLIINCIDPLIGEVADLEIPDDIDVRDELYDIRRIIGDLQDFDDDLGSEIIEARGSENSLGDRINLVESDVSNLNSEVDRINDSFNIVDKNGDIFSLYNSVPQGSVIYVLGEIDCLSKELILNKPIKIVGLSKDATLKNTSINIQSSDVFLSNFKIKTTMDNGVACNSGSYKNIRLYDVDSEAVAHSFLFENYNGIVEDVVLENCTARNSINGFISKSSVSFINCKSYGCGLNFGLVSDNIPSATQVANCEHSNIINCCAIGGSYGLHLYCRDKYNTDCVPRNRNNRIVNFTVKDCAYPIQVGEDVLYTGYKSFKEIEQTIFENIIVDGADNGQWSILLSHGKRCSFNNCSLNNKIQQVSAYQCVMSNILVKSENYVGRNIVNIDNSNAVIDTSMYNAVEVQYNANNNNTINLINGPNSAGLINVFIRTKGANGVSFGGFGSNIIDNNNILKTLNYNEGQNITFAFIEGVQKFIPILVTKNIKYD